MLQQTVLDSMKVEKFTMVVTCSAVSSDGVKLATEHVNTTEKSQ